MIVKDRKPAAPTARKPAAPVASTLTEIDIRVRVAEVAYYRAERRGFAPGRELEDWLEAEAEIRGRASAP